MTINDASQRQPKPRPTNQQPTTTNKAFWVHDCPSLLLTFLSKHKRGTRRRKHRKPSQGKTSALVVTIRRPSTTAPKRWRLVRAKPHGDRRRTRTQSSTRCPAITPKEKLCRRQQHSWWTLDVPVPPQIVDVIVLVRSEEMTIHEIQKVQVVDTSLSVPLPHPHKKIK